MIKYIAFTYDKHLYATCYGIDPFAADRCPYKNIFDPATAGRGEMRCFTSLVGGDEYSLPRLQDVEITVADIVAKFIAGKGWIEVNGIRYDVTFDSNGIKCIGPDGIDINIESAPVVEESTETLVVREEYTETESEESADKPVVETEEVVESVETEEVIAVPEDEEYPKDTSLKSLVKEFDIPDISLDFTETPEETVAPNDLHVEFVEAPQNIEEMTAVPEVIDKLLEAVKNEESNGDTGDTEDTLVEHPSSQVIEEFDNPVEQVTENVEPVLGVSEDFMNPPSESAVEKPSGIGFGDYHDLRSPIKSKLMIGGIPQQVGIKFGSFTPRTVETFAKPTLQRKSYTVTGRPITQPMYERVVNRQNDEVLLPSQELADAVARSEEQLVESWREQSRADISQSWDKPAICKEEKIPVEYDNVDLTDTLIQMEEEKQAFLDSLPSDVAKVIEILPLHIVGPIAEFTTNSVNTRRLSNESDAYCIDNRWHKAGKWYCIDVVNDLARYFFNSKLNVSIQISQATLKEWLRIVNG